MPQTENWAISTKPVISVPEISAPEINLPSNISINYNTMPLNEQAMKIRASTSMVFVCNYNAIESPMHISPLNKSNSSYFERIKTGIKAKYLHSQTLELNAIDALLEAVNELQIHDLALDADRYLTELETSIEPLIESGDEITALNIVFDKIDDDLITGKDNLIKAVLNQLDLTKFSIKFLIGFLSVTNPWKSYLNPSREKLLARIEIRIKEELGEERANRLLKGLK